MTKPVRPPDITELQTFCVAADMGSLGRAARRLHVSQPALTKRLRNLEALAGVQLLDRSPRGVTLTSAGRRLYEEARRALEQVAAVEDVLGELRQATTPLHVASSHSSTYALVGEALASLPRERYLAVELVVANSDAVRALVAEGRADMGVAAATPGRAARVRVHEELLAPDEVVLSVPLMHPWATRGSISQKEFLGTPMVLRDPTSNARITVEVALSERGLRAAAPMAEAGTPHAAKHEAKAHCAPLLLSAGVMAGDLDFERVRVEGLEFPRSFVIVLPSRGEPDARCRRLISHLREFVAGRENGD